MSRPPGRPTARSSRPPSTTTSPSTTPRADTRRAAACLCKSLCAPPRSSTTRASSRRRGRRRRPHSRTHKRTRRPPRPRRPPCSSLSTPSSASNGPSRRPSTRRRPSSASTAPSRCRPSSTRAGTRSTSRRRPPCSAATINRRPLCTRASHDVQISSHSARNTFGSEQQSLTGGQRTAERPSIIYYSTAKRGESRMTYNSVAEIFDDIDDTRARLLQTVEGLSAERQNFRPAPGKWSVAEILEHLSIVERRVAQLLGSLVEKAEAAGQTRAAAGPFAPVSIAEFVEQTRAQKLTAPENISPTGAALADSLSSLRDSRAALHALRPRVERVDGHAARFPHPAWGPINLYQWLAFVGAHEARHLAQINALKETMNDER